MNVKKIGLTGLVGFVAMAVVGGLSSGLYHAKHMTELSQKFPGIVQWPFDMVPPLLGMLVYIFVMAIIYDKMGVVGYEQGAITGAWFGAAKWFFFKGLQDKPGAASSLNVNNAAKLHTICANLEGISSSIHGTIDQYDIDCGVF